MWFSAIDIHALCQWWSVWNKLHHAEIISEQSAPKTAKISLQMAIYIENYIGFFFM